jgi:predicted acetyltransferase
MKNKVKLVLPNKKYALSYLKGEKEYRKDKKIIAAGGGTDLFHSLKDFHVYQRKMFNRRKGVNLKKGRVPSTLYWGIVGNKFVGRLDLRHRLNKNLALMGGHIGYAVVPSERKKGYGTEMLRLGLKKAKKLDIKKALVTCDETNIGSKKIIEKNGGIFASKIKEEGVYKLRYWIKI